MPMIRPVEDVGPYNPSDFGGAPLTTTEVLHMDPGQVLGPRGDSLSDEFQDWISAPGYHGPASGYPKNRPQLGFGMAFRYANPKRNRAPRSLPPVVDSFTSQDAPLAEILGGAVETKAQAESTRAARLKRLQDKENQLRGLLSGKQGELDNALEAQLDRLLADVGYKAGVARQQVGGDFASRGLLRSSFTQKGLDEVNLNEQTQKANDRQASFEASDSFRKAQDDAYRQIALKREALSSAQNEGDLKLADEVIYGINTNKIKSDYEAALTSLQIDAQEQARFNKSLSGLLVGLGNVFSDLANLKPAEKGSPTTVVTDHPDYFGNVSE